MHTRNEIHVSAPPDRCFRAAAEVERWPDILPHYREVRFTDAGDAPRVLMRAVRSFGPLPYPIWWESEMRTDADERVVRYRHVGGITTGMDVEWRLAPDGDGTRIVILHDWAGPGWPVIGGLAARRVIGPHFVHVVAGRTLAGLKRALEGDSVGEAP
jgi:uncharacterized membrane protein